MASKYNGQWKTLFIVYPNKNGCQKDLSPVLNKYSDLRMNKRSFVFNNGGTKDLVCLEGTIPIVYKGVTYNIPMAIWLKESHPEEAPMVFVTPTSTMSIRSGPHVDSNGAVTLPYIAQWRDKVSKTLDLVQTLVMVFSEQMPVYSKSPGNISAAVTGHGHRIDLPTTGTRPSCDSNKWEIFFCKFPDKEACRKDIEPVLLCFLDFRMNLKTCKFHSDDTKEMVCLEGTIPVHYKGVTYNIPMAIWLKESHPKEAPRVFVVPTNTMSIRVGPYVDSNGAVTIPYLTDWQLMGPSETLTLVQILVLAFSEKPPVYAKPAGQMLADIPAVPRSVPRVTRSSAPTCVNMSTNSLPGVATSPTLLGRTCTCHPPS